MVHRVDLLGLANVASGRTVVIKQFRTGTGRPEREWDALCFAHKTLPLSPGPLAFDRDGAWFGTPTIVMSHLPGRPILTPKNLDVWTAELAGTLAAIHRTPGLGIPASLSRPAIWERWSPDGLPVGAPVGKITAAFSAMSKRGWEQGFCHGDFHPGNVLFDSSGVSGVVDWASARPGPLLSDVGRCRGALAIWPGGHAPDRLRSRYRHLTGRDLDGLAYWDVVAGALFLAFGRAWMDVYHGLVDLDTDLAMQRTSAFVDNALEELRAGGSAAMGC